MGFFEDLVSNQDSNGGIRGLIDVASKYQGTNLQDIIKDVMTNSPEGMRHFTKAPWSFFK